MSENVGPGASEECAAEGMPFSSRDYGIYYLFIVSKCYLAPYIFSFVASSSGNR